MPDKIDPPKDQDSTTVFPDNNKAPTLDGKYYEKISVRRAVKHDISSQKLYELLIRIELKDDTALELKNFYNHIKMCMNVVTII